MKTKKQLLADNDEAAVNSIIAKAVKEGRAVEDPNCEPGLDAWAASCASAVEVRVHHVCLSSCVLKKAIGM